ncbi:MAG: tetratricopeptide repeat protein [Thermodesulfobacteriota bacterium]|nr:tetratricopeptide repeat protein [Thermodesulfobacteriota bacterium]
MSYIHEALKKAQREKDRLGSDGGTVWASYRQRPRLFSRQWLLLGGLVLIAVVFLSHSWSDLIHQRPSPNQAKAVVRQPAGKPAEGLHASRASRAPLKPLPPKPKTASGAGKETTKISPVQGKQETKGPEIQKAVPKSPGPNQGAALYGQALALQKQGRLQEGKALYVAALEHSPKLVSALNNLGAIYIQEKNYPAAGEAFEKAIRIKPGYVDPYYNLACLHALQNDVGRSLFYLKKAISIDRHVKKWASADKDLENLHGHSEYEKIVATVQES